MLASAGSSKIKKGSKLTSSNQSIDELIGEAEALLAKLDEIPTCPAAAHVASAISALQEILEPRAKKSV